MSFIIVILSKGTEGIKALTNSEKFIWFYEDIWRRLADEKSQTPVIIWDKTSFHTFKESTEFMKSKGIKWITITPYSP